jgi:hypothetical protein
VEHREIFENSNNLTLLHVINPAKGRLDFDVDWLMKTSLIIQDKMKPNVI